MEEEEDEDSEERKSREDESGSKRKDEEESEAKLIQRQFSHLLPETVGEHMHWHDHNAQPLRHQDARPDRDPRREECCD